VLTLTPHTLRDVWSDVERVGGAVGLAARGVQLATQLRARVDAVAERFAAGGGRRVRVLCLEWIEPLYVAGHWVPEMVAAAGGVDVFARPGEASVRVTSEQIAECGADVMLVMPCGYDAARAAREFSETRFAERWPHLPAVRDGRVFAIDANSYTSRPGPRLADGVEMMLAILHPRLGLKEFGAEEFRRIATARSAACR
jgi:iron complex transport system substrate-binding protein